MMKRSGATDKKSDFLHPVDLKPEKAVMYLFFTILRDVGMWF